MCARGLFYLIPSFRFRFAEQFLEIDPAFRGTGGTSWFSCVADLPLEPEPEVDRGCLSCIHQMLPLSVPFAFSLGLYPRKKHWYIGATLIFLSDRHLQNCPVLSYKMEKCSSMRNILHTIYGLIFEKARKKP
jgi:hypothetical protein